MIGRRGLLATAAAVAVSACAAPAALAVAQDYTIRVEGSKSGLGKVRNVSLFRPDRDPSRGSAIANFGPPSSTSKRDSLCRTGWKSIGLRINFVNLGGGDACASGSAQTISAFGARWHTQRQLFVGDSVAEIRRLYKGAYRKGKTYRLAGGKNIYGAGGGRYSVLAAKTNGKKITSFRLFVGAAGE